MRTRSKSSHPFFYVSWPNSKGSVGFFRLVLGVLEDKAYQQEVDGNGNGIDANWGHLRAQSHPKEEVQQSHLEEVVDQVGSTKAGSVFGICLLMEDEVGRQVVVDDKSGNVSSCPCYVDIDNKL